MSNQPAQALLGLLNPQQKQIFNQFQGKPSNEQAEMIAKICNEKGITKDQLVQIVNYFNGNKS
jgi:uncharacterized protein involved in tellurium resistance